MSIKTPEQTAIQIVLENYGRESDPEVWEASRDEDNPSAQVPEKHLLDAALDAQHLDGDGILAMMRAQRGTYTFDEETIAEAGAWKKGEQFWGEDAGVYVAGFVDGWRGDRTQVRA